MADYIEVPTPDGRILEVLTEGDPAGLPAALPLGHAERRGAVPAARPGGRGAGLRVLTYSRPGYGESTPWPYSERGPRIADDVVDVLALLHHLGDRRVRDPRLVGRRAPGAGLRRDPARPLPGGRDAWPAWRRTTPTGSTGTPGMADGERRGVRGRGRRARRRTTSSCAASRAPEPDTTPAELIESHGRAADADRRGRAHRRVRDVPADAFDPQGPGAGRGRLARRRPGARRALGLRRRARSPCRCRSGTAGRTRWCRSRTASGWRRTCRARGRTCSTTRGTSRCGARSTRAGRAQGARGHLSDLTGATPAARRGR